MKFKKKFLYTVFTAIIFFILSLILISINKKVYAQTYTCQWVFPGGCIVLDNQECLNNGCSSNCNQFGYNECFPDPHPCLNCVTPTPNPANCPVNYVCMTVSTPDLCQTGGGISQPCPKPVGQGNCCMPAVAPTIASCPVNYVCMTVTTPDLCQTGGGISQPCPKPVGQGNCCMPGGPPIEDCQEKCTDSSHPFAMCLDTHGVDPPGCVNPPGYNYYNCLLNNLDCLCCMDSTLRGGLNPLCGESSINTAIGCIPVGNQDDFLAFILKWALGVAGGVAFILIVYSGFLFMTSAGDKQKVQAAKELMTAAISGLLLIIFSVFLLDLFGIRILKIPGL